MNLLLHHRIQLPDFFHSILSCYLPFALATLVLITRYPFYVQSPSNSYSTRSIFLYFVLSHLAPFYHVSMFSRPVSSFYCNLFTAWHFIRSPFISFHHISFHHISFCPSLSHSIIPSSESISSVFSPVLTVCILSNLLVWFYLILSWLISFSYISFILMIILVSFCFFSSQLVTLSGWPNNITETRNLQSFSISVSNILRYTEFRYCKTNGVVLWIEVMMTLQ